METSKRRKLEKAANGFFALVRRKHVLVLSVIGGILLTIFVQSFEMNLFEAYLYDIRVRASGSTAKKNLNTVLISIDDNSTDKLNEYAPLSMKTHLSLLKTLETYHPKAIAYILDFNDAVGSQEAGSNQKTDADKFVELSESLNQKGIPVLIGTDVDVTGEVLPPFPLSRLPHKPAMLHKDGTIFSEDKVTRRAVFSIYEEPVLHVQLARLFSNTADPSHYRGVYYMPEVEAKYFLINYVGRTQEKYQPFTEISAIDLLNGKVSPELLKDKVVLIGTKSKENSNDYAYTPYSRTIYSNPKLVVHANILETLIKNNSILQAPHAADVVLTFLLTCLIIVMVFKTTPEKGVIATFLVSAALILFATMLFRFTSVWINLAHPLIGISGAYYIFVPYRLIMEYKQRWEIQKKHEVLMQVEELKSNFMSLITHDLKTPVARIQGMAEILKSSGADTQITSEILGSTDELNRFISSILELAKIESNHVQIQKQSKDINKIIEDTVRKFRFTAETSGIELKAELEPLFPVIIDTILINKVLSNLIDNALKYSPKGSTVTVLSRESVTQPGMVEVEIKDTGYGIKPSDLENLFAKFFRPKNDITLTTKGTGLGLYLSRYFVELHNGSLTVESEEGKGSTFKILLPMEDDISLTKNLTQSGGHAYV